MHQNAKGKSISPRIQAKHTGSAAIASGDAPLGTWMPLSARARPKAALPAEPRGPGSEAVPPQHTHTHSPACTPPSAPPRTPHPAPRARYLRRPSADAALSGSLHLQPLAARLPPCACAAPGPRTRGPPAGFWLRLPGDRLRGGAPGSRCRCGSGAGRRPSLCPLITQRDHDRPPRSESSFSSQGGPEARGGGGLLKQTPHPGFKRCRPGAGSITALSPGFREVCHHAPAPQVQIKDLIKENLFSFPTPFEISHNTSSFLNGHTCLK
jgi:hypothetical protein